MDDQKIENLLNLALDATVQEREKSESLEVGFEPETQTWAVIVRYSGDILEQALERSSMGIRVDPETLDRQLSISGCDHRRELQFHQMLLGGELPLTIGGGIGQSRLCMQLLGKAHVGEVQAGIWDEATLRCCRDAGVILL